MSMEASLITAISVLWAALVAIALYVRRSAEQCERDRRALWKAILEMQPRSCSQNCPSRKNVPLSASLIKLAQERSVDGQTATG